MDWNWTAVVASGITLVAGFALAQLGSFLQSRRDDRSQAERNQIEAARETRQLEAESDRLTKQLGAESGRLDKQLAAQAAEAKAQRNHDDLIDWRSRRLAAYSLVSTAAAKVAAAAQDVASSAGPWPTVAKPPSYDETKSLVAELVAARDEAALISDASLRETGTRLLLTANGYDHHARNVERAATNLAEAQENERNNVPKPTEPLALFFWNDLPTATIRNEEALVSFRTARSDFEDALLAWVTECRQALGVSD